MVVTVQVINQNISSRKGNLNISSWHLLLPWNHESQPRGRKLSSPAPLFSHFIQFNVSIYLSFSRSQALLSVASKLSRFLPVPSNPSPLPKNIPGLISILVQILRLSQTSIKALFVVILQRRLLFNPQCHSFSSNGSGLLSQFSSSCRCHHSTVVVNTQRSRMAEPRIGSEREIEDRFLHIPSRAVR